MAYNVNEDYETQLNEAEERIIELEKQLAEAKNVDASANSLHKHIVTQRSELLAFVKEVAAWDKDYSSTNLKLKAKQLLKANSG